MSTPDDLDLALHPGFDRHWRIAECIFIFGLSAVCAAALTGALGSGPLSHACAHLDGSAVETLQYERIVRNHGSSWMKIGLRRGVSGTVDVHLDSALTGSVAIDAINPHPSATRVSGNGTTYTFEVLAAHGGSLDFRLSPYRFGPVHTTVAVDGNRINIAQIVRP